MPDAAHPTDYLRQQALTHAAKTFGWHENHARRADLAAAQAHPTFERIESALNQANVESQRESAKQGAYSDALCGMLDGMVFQLHAACRMVSEGCQKSGMPVPARVGQIEAALPKLAPEKTTEKPTAENTGGQP